MELLSTDLHLYLTSFLDYGDKISLGSCCLSFYHNLLFNHLRRVHAYGRSKWWRIESHEELRERLEKCVLAPDRQFHVTVTRNDAPESFPFPNVQTLHTDFDEFTDYLVHDIQKIHRLELVINELNLFSEIILTDDYGIKSLIVSNEANDDEVDTEMSLPLTPPPSSLEYLELNGPFSTISPEFVNTFVHLHELSLKKVSNISNIHVRMFVNIPKIKLDTCENFDDITPLQFTRDISIISCTGVLDYRNSLTYSRRISIQNPNLNALIDLNCFKAVQSLDISWNVNPITSKLPLTVKRLTIGGNIFFVDNFAHLQEVTIELSSTEINLQPLCCVPILGLTNLQGVHSLHGLGYNEDRSKGLRNRKVSLLLMNSVEDFSPLNTIETVQIVACQKFYDFVQVKDVKNLTVDSWIGKITAPINAEKLTLSGAIKGNLFLYLANVKELDVCGLSGNEATSLQGFENLTKLERIQISNLWGMQETKGWETLLKDYSKFIVSPHPLIRMTIYVKKTKG